MEARMADWFAERLTQEQLLIVAGAYDGLSAKAVENAGFEAIYLSGYGVAAAHLGRPDLGILGFAEALGVYTRVREVTSVPLIADADTGYGGPLNVARTIREFARAGISAIQIEDQKDPKRCGHLEDKVVLPLEESLERLAVAVAVAGEEGVAIIARTDGLPSRGIDATIERLNAFMALGATAVFVDAVPSVDAIRSIRANVVGPMVFNAAPTGRSPRLSREEIAELGFSVVIHPVETLWAAWRAVTATLTALRSADGVPDVLPGVDTVFNEFNEFVGVRESIEWAARFARPSEA
jgi:2-methylisocitrate lyase-like PEP mutase family enzyme